MEPPEVKQFGRVFRLIWPKFNISVSRIYEATRGEVTAEINMNDNEGLSLMVHERYNLTSRQTRNNMVKHLSRFDVDGMDAGLWEDVVSMTVNEVMNRLRSENKPEVISMPTKIKAPEYLIDPIIPYGVPTIIFGPGGTCKSGLTDWFSVLIANAPGCEAEGLRIRREPTAVLKLDWETDKNTWDWRIQTQAEGLGLPTDGLYYRRCEMPLVDEVESIQQQMLEIGASVTIVDSAGWACKWNLNLPEVAMDFFRAVRQLQGTTIIIHHTQKENPANPQEKTPYGSAYFLNSARSVWQIKKTQEPDANIIDVGLFHTKVNEGKLCRPRGYRFTFEMAEYGCDTNKTTVKSIDVAQTGLISNLPLHVQLQAELKDGPKTHTELAELVEKNPDQVRTRLNQFSTNQNRKPRLFQKMGDKWGLAYENGGEQ